MNELDRDQISMLKSTFDAFDVERKGYIETEMVGIIMDMLGAQVNAEELEGIINEIDEDENGEITFQEFLTLAAKFLVEEDEDTDAIQTELKGAFRMYDREGEMVFRADWPWSTGTSPLPDVSSLTARDIFSGSKCFDVVVYLVTTIEQLSCHQLFKTRRQVPQYGPISPGDHFTWFHREGNGFITTQVLREILRELDDNLSENDLDNMIEEIDADGSGTVDWEEFRAVMIG